MYHTAGKQVCDRCFSSGISLPVDDCDFRGGALDELRWRDQITNAQRRCQQFRHRTDVDDFASAVEAGQREHWPVREVELVTVVVLDDCKVELFGKGQHPHTSRCREQDRGGELMVGGDVDRSHALAITEFLQLIDLQTVFIESDCNDFSASRTKRFARRRIAECFDHNTIARTYQHPCGDIDSHLTATHDADVVFTGRDTSLTAEHAQNFLPDA